jgi:hypothetical protein
VVFLKKGVGEKKLMPVGVVAVDAVCDKVAEIGIINLHLQRRLKKCAATAVLVINDEIPEHELRRKEGRSGRRSVMDKLTET